MDLGINNLCLDIFEKLSIKLAHFEEMLELTQQLEAKSLDTELESYREILEQRQALINKIDQVNIEINLIQKNIIQKVSLKNFNLRTVRSYISEDLYKKLTTQSDTIQDKVWQIQKLDEECNKNVKMAKEGAKLQLLRVRSILHPNRSYHKVYEPEPRFVDKKR